MLKTSYYSCNTFEETKAITNNLDKAMIVKPFKFNVVGVEHTTNDWKGIFNITQGYLTKPVGEIYNLVTHKEFLDTFSETLERLNIKFEMNIRSMGNTVITDVEFIEKKLEFKTLNEEFITGIRIINSYDRAYAVTISPRLKRLACLNGMVLQRDESCFNVKHSANLVKEIEKLVETKITDIINKYKDFQVLVEQNIKDSIEWNMVGNIIEKLFKQPKHIEEILKNLGITRLETENVLDKKKPIITYTRLLNNNKVTRWELYNAITKYLTHGELLSPYIENAMQIKAEKVLLTPLLEIKA
jgi:hypothetical protein